jgi:hypothetical protein
LSQDLSISHDFLDQDSQVFHALAKKSSTRVGTDPSINYLFTLFAQFIGHDLSSVANDKDDESKQINCQCQEKIKNPFYMNNSTHDISDVFSTFKCIFLK